MARIDTTADVRSMTFGSTRPATTFGVGRVALYALLVVLPYLISETRKAKHG